MKEKNRGLTLISLVITVVILLILAVTSISILTSENGLIRNGFFAKESTEITEEKNILKASAVSALSSNSMEGIKEEDLEYYLDQNVGDEDYILEKQDDSYLVTFIEDSGNKRELNKGRQYIILNDATVLEADEEYLVFKLQPSSIPSLEIGDKAEISAVTNIDGQITWTSSNTDVAIIEEDETDNKRIEVVGREIGTTQIVAVIEKDGITKTVYCNAEVIETQKIKVLSVEIEKTKEIIDLSEEDKTIQLTAIINPSFANSGTELTWTSSDTNVATVDETGLVTGVGNGTATITVTTSNDKTDSCDITVQTSPTGIALNKTSTILDLSGTKEEKLVATIEPQEANVQNKITWTSSDTNIVTVDQTGLITGISNGTATITASTENGKTAECTVVVRTSITEIALNQNNITLKPGEKTTITASIKPDNLTLTEELTWTSSNTSVATISTSGTYKTTCDVTTNTPGQVTITAQNPSGTIKQTCTILVLPTVSATNAKYTLKAYYESVYDYDCDSVPYQDCKQVSYKDCFLFIFCSTKYRTECTTKYRSECGYEYAGQALRSGSTTISFQLSSYIPVDKLKLEKTGISQVNVGSIQVTDQTNGKYKISLSTSSTSFTSGQLSLKYVDGNTSIELYKWEIGSN